MVTRSYFKDYEKCSEKKQQKYTYIKSKQSKILEDHKYVITRYKKYFETTTNTRHEDKKIAKKCKHISRETARRAKKFNLKM